MKSVHDFFRKKANNQKIAMITCYDYTSASIVDKTNVDVVLVGDSGIMTMYGAPNTIYASIDHLVFYTEAVANGINNKFIISDLPFLGCRKSKTITLNNIERLIKAGAHAIKIEGATGNLEIIQHIVESGIPIMGHLGLTPQHFHQLGGFKVQAKNNDSAETLFQHAKQMEEAGCFSIVLECIPENVAERITEALQIPTIGIGAGAKTDGQVLVFQDLLGLQNEFHPKFLKQYLNGEELFKDSINHYVEDVQLKRFPTKAHCYLADGD